MKIVIPGGSGQVGHILARAFVAAGHEVVVLSRRPAAGERWREVQWDGASVGDWAAEVDGAEVVVNLAGRSVDCRNTEKNRRQILASRVDSTRALGEAIARASRPPRVWLQSSTATIYAHRYDAPNDEATGLFESREKDYRPDWSFSVGVAKVWEQTAMEADTPSTRKVMLRSAMIMSPDRGGIFDVLLKLVRLGLGGTAGSGRQYVSWIHDADFVRAIFRLIEDESFTGPVNLASPGSLPYKDFMRALRQAWGQPIGLPATCVMLEIGRLRDAHRNRAGSEEPARRPRAAARRRLPVPLPDLAESRRRSLRAPARRLAAGRLSRRRSADVCAEIRGDFSKILLKSPLISAHGRSMKLGRRDTAFLAGGGNWYRVSRVDPTSEAIEKPRWLRDLLRFLPLKSQFVLSGNVRDLQLTEVAPGSVASQPLLAALAFELRGCGYAQVLAYDPVAGFRVLAQPGEAPSAGSEALVSLGLQPGAAGAAPAGLELFSEALQRISQRPPAEPPWALLVDFAGRLAIRPDVLSAAEHQAFTRALVLSHQAKPRSHGSPPRPFFDTVVWIVDKEGELPDWLLVANPRIRHIPVAKPDHRARRALAGSLLRIFGAEGTSPDAFAAAVDELVEQTEGLLLSDLKAIAQLGRSEGLALARIGDAVRRYKVGVKDDPWARIDRARIRGGADFVRARVRGQDPAVVHLLDIVKRAVTGVGAPKRGNRPRGVAFLAGPTGVGKTELAKTLTSLLFGDENAYIRFDMSEFSAEHSDQRLIGAPPGYVGYDVGGELTNAIREKPFSVVLFDEIEKAHPRILDKFLQILDDGVLTSGRGDRVYFSEAFILFTSNLGIYRREADGSRVANVTPEEPYELVAAKIRAEIENHFKIVLNRPEILNRIGDNVLVFDFIRREIAEQIFGAMVEAVLADVVAAQGIALALRDAARDRLREICLADLTNGGRGIRNKVESHLINPLARALFDGDVRPGARLAIVAVDSGAAGETRLVLEEAG